MPDTRENEDFSEIVKYKRFGLEYDKEKDLEEMMEERDRRRERKDAEDFNS